MFRVCYILLLSCCVINAQDINKSSIDELLETYLEDATIQEDNQQIYDLLEQLSDEPINLNTANAEELQKIPFIDFDTASKIIEHRNKYGRYFSVNALNMIGDIPPKTIGIIKRFLYVEEIPDKDLLIPGVSQSVPSDKKIQISMRSRLMTDLQERRGYRENLFAGSSLKAYNRMQIRYGNFRFGALAEKDAGENSYRDFLSYHFEAKNLGIIDRVVLGDYLVEFGQGLAVWSPYSLSKGSDATGPVSRSDRRIISYTSTDENRFFRGAAANVSISNFSLSTFYSYKKIDASVEIEKGRINSILYSGLHRTRSELNNQEMVSQRVMGATLSAQLFSNTAVPGLYSSEYLIPRVKNLGSEILIIRYHRMPLPYIGKLFIIPLRSFSNS